MSKIPEPGSESGAVGEAQVILVGNGGEERAAEAGKQAPPGVMDLFRKVMSKLDKTGEDMNRLSEAMRKNHEELSYLSPDLTPPLSPSAPASPVPQCLQASPRDCQRWRKPSEFDGKVAWEAYLAQFELLAGAQGWDDHEKALQLVSGLRGAALEVLAHLTSQQRTVYSHVVGALQRRFGHHHQAEVYRARLKARVRAKGESLPQLAQELETLVRHAYPAAAEDMVTVLTRDYFVDALQDRELQLYIKQVHPEGVQVALARALELEAFLCTSVLGAAVEVPRKFYPNREFRARRTQVGESPVEQCGATQRVSLTGFQGICWRCGKKGHRWSDCPRGRRTRSPERKPISAFQPYCGSCGPYGHFSVACTASKDMQVGNEEGLDAGANSQPTLIGSYTV
ncbi:putative nitric oxide synthase-like [Penaeus vannamei]|uniref:Putative nitric oxide synthase-like n=1 Tax=Penaeus vannamei TaxID=6689 RepID=A0A423SKK0_PENVA|nr:putative nitric oxide synthase-like [Penaeus vannamei]